VPVPTTCTIFFMVPLARRQESGGEAEGYDEWGVSPIQEESGWEGS
jgi:hypothetical protein